MAELHLWEVDHPYYCSAATWHKVSDHTRWTSWADFRDETIFTTGDRDLNMLARWDWHSWRREADEDLRSDRGDELELFFVMQRKGYLASHSIVVTDEDEAEIRAFLVECAATIAQLWQPIIVPSLATAPKSTGVADA